MTIENEINSTISSTLLNKVIEDKFGTRLVQCPECSTIISSYDQKEEPRIYPYTKPEWWFMCENCSFSAEEWEFPDLFTD